MAIRLITILWATLLATAASAEPLAARFELAGQIQWSADGLAESIKSAGGAMMLTDKAPARTREVPGLARGADGRLWLSTRKQLGAIGKAGFEALPLTALDAQPTEIAPLADGVIVLGSNGRENVLARLDATGKAVWRRAGPMNPAKADLTALEGVIRRLSVDGDGSVYLYATRQAGQVAKVNPADGATTVALALPEFRSPSAWVLGGTLYRVQPADAKTFTWVAHKLGEAADGAPISPTGDLATTLGSARGPLPGGGALLMPRVGWQRMAPDGGSAGALPLAGIVRAGDGLAVALASGDGLSVTRWPAAGAPVQLGPINGHARLVAADDAGYQVVVGRSVMAAGKLLTFGPDGKQTAELGLDGQGEKLLALEGQVDIGQPVVEPDGALLVAGADPKGAFVVRVRLP
ncbi:MAG: hypothetical protein KC620_00090 [Myxococcales bacterium]|nr:hypothetical protein [Myxococcales bacterium]